MESIDTQEPRKPTRRGVYLLPTSLTIVNVFFGFTAILLALRGSKAMILDDPYGATRAYSLACWSLLAAAIFDTFDGLVARLMHATSEFGKEYDSLADVVTFGVAPAILVYTWGLHLWGRLGGGIAFLFLVAGSLRLARFNIQASRVDHRFFVGLPIPAGALTLAAIIFYYPEPVTDLRFAAIMMVATTLLALAMVSTLRYRSQKYQSLFREKPAAYLFVIAIVLVLVYRWTEEFFFFGSIAYVLSAPLTKLWMLVFRRGSTPAPAEELLEADSTEPAPKS